MGNTVTTKTIDLSSIEVDNLTKECYLSQLETKVIEYSDKNIVSEKIDTIINNTFAYKGQSPATEREYVFISNAVKEDVFHNFNLYTLKDIELAFKLGVRGEMGEYYGLNPKTFYDWLKKYKDKFLFPALEKVESLLPKKTVQEPPKEVVQGNNKEIVCNVLESFKQTKKYDFNDFGNMIYNFLERIGIINFSIQEKENIISESKIKFKLDLAKRNEELNNLGKVYQKIDLTKAFDELERESNKDYETQIKILAKKIALQRFIENCAYDNIDLENIINQKISTNGNK